MKDERLLNVNAPEQIYPRVQASNGRAARLPEQEVSRWARLAKMAKTPTTLPRWALFLSNGALIATVIVGAISFGKSAGRTEAALANSAQVPEIQANVVTITQKLDEIGRKQDQALANQDKRLERLEASSANTAMLNTKVDTLAGQMGSVWALAQSDSNKISRLEGMIIAMQNQKKEKE